MKGYRLNQWIVEPSRCRLVSGRKSIRLQAREMELLERLAEAGGEVVSKEELIRDVWGDRIVVDHVLPKTISSLRKSFGESAREPRIIQTLPKRGYRLGCALVPVESREAPSAKPRRSRLFRLVRAAAFCAWLVAPVLLVGYARGGATGSVDIERVEAVKLPVRIHIDTGLESEPRISSLGALEGDPTGRPKLQPSEHP